MSTAPLYGKVSRTKTTTKNQKRVERPRCSKTNERPLARAPKELGGEDARELFYKSPSAHLYL